MKHLCSTEVRARGALGRPRRLSVALLGSCWLVASLAPAQPGAPSGAGAATAAGVSRSDALVEQGMRLRREGNDEAALTAFEEATTLDPESTRARVHLAAAHQALGHWQQADELLAELLQRLDDPYVQRHQATLSRAREFVGQHLGTLLILGQPDGALVKVDGRELGQLPLSKPLRLPVGSHQLEVSRPGHYPLQRPITLAAGGTLRESVALAPAAPQASLAAPGGGHGGAVSGAPRWLPWTLTGLAAGAAVATGVAWGVRNHHASRWNGDACLQPGRLRGEVCPEQRADGKRAEQLAYLGGVATVLLGAGAAVSWTLQAAPANERASAGALTLRCQLTLGQGLCSGSF